MELFLIVVLTFLPAAAWVFFYRYIDFADRDPMRVSLSGFLIGCFSLLPLILIEWIFLHYPSYNVFLNLQNLIANDELFLPLFYLSVSFLEEGLKVIAFLVFVQLFRPSFNQVIDGLIYGAMIGIGFAYVENVHFFVDALQTFEWSANFLSIFNIRSFGTMLAHTLFTGLFGFYFGKAYFSGLVQASQKKSKGLFGRHKQLLSALHFRASIHFLLPYKKNAKPSLSRLAVLIEGYLLAVMAHFLFNVFINFEFLGVKWIFLTIPLILLLGFGLWSKCFVPAYIRIIHIVTSNKTIN